jgi:hypothetical protein
MKLLSSVFALFSALGCDQQAPPPLAHCADTVFAVGNDGYEHVRCSHPEHKAQLKDPSYGTAFLVCVCERQEPPK